MGMKDDNQNHTEPSQSINIQESLFHLSKNGIFLSIRAIVSIQTVTLFGVASLKTKGK